MVTKSQQIIGLALLVLGCVPNYLPHFSAKAAIPNDIDEIFLDADEFTMMRAKLAIEFKKIDSDLFQLLVTMQRYDDETIIPHPPRGLSATAATSRVVMLEDDDKNEYVLVDVFGAIVEQHSLKGYLESIGFKISSCYKNVCSGMLPVEKIMDISSSSFIKKVTIPKMVTNQGSVTSEGDIAIRTNIAREVFDVNGSGQKVGVLSNSYDCLGGAAMDIATGDLPSADKIEILMEFASCTRHNVSNIDEGRALMQIVHDVAPGAELAFYTGFGGVADFANGMISLADADCTVIVDDVIYFEQPIFQDGILAQAAEEVVARGIPYFTSVGNAYSSTWEEPNGFVDSGVPVILPTGQNLGNAHMFSNGRITQTVTLARVTSFSLFWDEPYGSLGGRGSESDLEVLLIYTDPESGNRAVIAFGLDSNIGLDPVEFLTSVPNILEIVPNDGPFEAELIITLRDGPPPKFLKVIAFDFAAQFEITTIGGTLVGHPNAANVAAVGASFFIDTPPFGVDPPRINFVSSRGGISILFDTASNRLDVPEVRQQPRVIGPDGGLNTFFGLELVPNEFRFFGTSAAAPHVAGLAALILEADNCLYPAEIYTILEDSAIDMDDPLTPGVFDVGFDFHTGYGFVNATNALESVLVDSLKKKKSKKSTTSSTTTTSSTSKSSKSAKSKKCKSRKTSKSAKSSSKSEKKDKKSKSTMKESSPKSGMRGSSGKGKNRK